jgi:hypothetical protein
MWIYKIKGEKNTNGFWDIPKNCVNAEFGNFDQILKYDDKRLVKSALCNWFSDIHNNELFSINFNGYDSICLQGSDRMEEFEFYHYSVIENYLLHHTNEIEYEQVKFLANRYFKIDKILGLIK